MECNKEEARRAIDLAEKKISENDYNGAKKLINKAQRLYPELDGLKQVLMMVDVYISATNKISGEADWYGILGVDPLADDEAMKKQYKNLALLLHPDKNKFNGAEGAFKLVSQAWDLLSNKVRRIAYNQKRRHNQPKPHEPKPKPKPEPEPGSSWKYVKAVTFFTMCKRCNAYCEYVKKFYLDRTFPCPNCGQDFVASFVADEITPEMSYGKPVFRLSISFQPTRKNGSDASSSSSTSSASDSAKAHNAANAERTKAELIRKWFEKSRVKFAAAAVARGNANPTTREAERPSKKPMTNSTHEAERPFKKPMTTGNANSTNEAEKPFKKPMTTENVNSTAEAQRLFKKPMTTENVNSTAEAQRLFKKPMTTGNANSTAEARRLFKKPMTAENVNSTAEAERLFKKPMTTGNANSTHEAQRLFEKPMTPENVKDLLLKLREFSRSL